MSAFHAAQRHSRKTTAHAEPVCLPTPHAFRHSHLNPVPMTAAGAFTYYASELLCSAPLAGNGCDTLLSRVDHDDNGTGNISGVLALRPARDEAVVEFRQCWRLTPPACRVVTAL